MTAPAGWYSDNTQPGHERYWNGTEWSSQTRPAAAGAANEALDKAERNKQTNKRTLKIVGAVLGVLILLGIIGSLGGNDDDKDSVATDTPSAAPQTQTTTPPAAPKTPEQEFTEAVKKKLGKSNRKGVTKVDKVTFSGGVATVRFAADDNLTDNLLKTGARIDTLDVIELAKNLPGLKELGVTVTYSLQNDLGEVSEDVVGRVRYSADIVQRINVDTIERKKVWNVADIDSYTHPAFEF